MSLALYSGAQLEFIICHITLSILVRRDTLCLLHFVYDFIRLHRDERAPLSESIKRELRWVRFIFLVSDLALPWSDIPQTPVEELLLDMEMNIVGAMRMCYRSFVFVNNGVTTLKIALL